MSRGLSAGAITALKNGAPYAHLWEFQFKSGTERVWTGNGAYDLTHEANTYTALGPVMNFATLETSSDNVPGTATITVEASDPAMVTRILDGSEVEGRTVTQWFGVIDVSNDPPDLLDTYVVFRRRMTSGTFNRTKLVWQIICEPVLVQQTRARRRVRAHEDQLGYAVDEPFPSDNWATLADDDQFFRDVTRPRINRIAWPAPKWRRQLNR